MTDIFGMIGSKNMGEYCDEQRAIRYYEEHKDDYELKTIDIKHLFNIPILHIKQSKYEKVYSLFNLIPIFSIINYKGWN